jgi:phosphoesterase RecJ-like protein
MSNMETQFKQLLDMIKGAKTAAFVGHVRPDGDSIGCSVAMRLALLEKGYTVADMFIDGEVPQTFSYIAEAVHYNKPTLPEGEKYDILFVLDCSEINRIGACIGLVERAKKIVVIDHHLSTDIRADLVISDSTFASTGEIVFDFFVSGGIKLNKEIAEALYTAIASDTGCFLFSCTTSHSHHVAAELMKYGINLELINYRNFRVINPENFGGLIYVLKTTKFIYNGKISILYFSHRAVKKFKIDDNMRHRLQKYASDVLGVRVNIVLTESEKGVFHISLRSHGSINVAQIAESLGGGGHRNASGLTMEGKVRDAIKTVSGKVIEYLNDFEK